MDEISSKDSATGGFSDNDVPLLSWDEIYHKITLSPRARPSSMNVENPFATSQIDSVLSASSYPFPEPLHSPPQWSISKQLYGGLILDSDTPGQDLSARKDTHLTTRPDLKRSRKYQQNHFLESKGPSKKRGRPPKAAPTEEAPDERRRMQIRLAQRAYRSRKEANIASLRSRVDMLETAVETMSSAMLSLSNELVISGALKSHPDLTSSLRDTVQTCLSLAKETTKDMNDQEDVDTSPHSKESLPSSNTYSKQTSNPKTADGALTIVTPETFSPLEVTSAPKPSFDITETPVGSLESADIEVSAFIERLHFTCLYQGLLALGDQSIPTSRLEPPFRLLFSMMDRKSVRSYFEAALHAKISQKRLEEWKHVPFFCLGGAGTHYPQPVSSSPPLESPFHPYQRWTLVQDPLSRFSPNVKDELDGDWFDIKDLEWYLREKRVCFRSSPAASKPQTTTEAVVNVVRFLPALISKAVCLGRTPGFRRYDVDTALVSASC